LSDKFGKQGMIYLRSVTLKGDDTAILNNYLDLLEETEKKIKMAEKQIRSVCREDKICALLSSVPGIGNILAVTIRYEIDDIERSCQRVSFVHMPGLFLRPIRAVTGHIKGRLQSREQMVTLGDG